MPRQMSKRHQHVLSKHMTFLQDNIILVGTFYGSLVEKEVFTDEMIEKIKTEKTTSDRILKLISLLKSCGPDAFDKFIATCEDTGQKHIAETLTTANNESLEDMPYDKSRQVEEIIEKTLGQRVMKTIGMQQKAELVTHLVLKVDYQKEREDNRVLSQDIRDYLDDIDKLKEDLVDANRKLTKVIGLNKKQKEEINAYKEQIEQLLKKERTNTDTDEDMVDAQQTTDLTKFEDEITSKSEQIRKLEDKLDSQGKQFFMMKGKLLSQITERDNAIEDVNKQLSYLCVPGTTNQDGNNNVKKEDQTKRVMLLHMNVDFLMKKIEHIQRDLLKANAEVISLQENEERCLEVLGVQPDSENNGTLLTYLQGFLQDYESERDRQKVLIVDLKEKLISARKTKSLLQRELETLKFDKALMKHNLKFLKEQHTRLTNPSTGSPTTQRSHSGGSNRSDDNVVTLPSLPGTQRHFRHPKLHRSETEPHSLSQSHHGMGFTRKVRHLSINDSLFPKVEKMVCIVCHTAFKMEENHGLACKYHPNTFVKQETDKTARWQCCFKSTPTATGCCLGKHKLR